MSVLCLPKCSGICDTCAGRAILTVCVCMCICAFSSKPTTARLRATTATLVITFYTHAIAAEQLATAATARPAAHQQQPINPTRKSQLRSMMVESDSTTVDATKRLHVKKQTLDDAYAVPANFLEIDVVNPMTTLTPGKKRYTDYEVRMRVSTTAKATPKNFVYQQAKRSIFL